MTLMKIAALVALCERTLEKSDQRLPRLMTTWLESRSGASGKTGSSAVIRGQGSTCCGRLRANHAVLNFGDSGEPGTVGG
jgi:hypothetical protein